MNPIKFKEQNVIFTKPEGWNDEECGDLPAYKNEEQIISCWKLSFKERLKILFTGIIWFGVFVQVQPPIWLDVKSPFMKSKGIHYTIKSGDTLHSIAQEFYGTPEKHDLIYRFNRKILDQKAKSYGFKHSKSYLQSMPDKEIYWIFPGEKIIIPCERQNDKFI